MHQFVSHSGKERLLNDLNVNVNVVESNGLEEAYITNP
jgi:hypothetical protein